jgi:hypothetical protein
VTVASERPGTWAQEPHARSLRHLSLVRRPWPLLVLGLCFFLLAVLRFSSFTSDTYLSLVGGREVAENGLPHLDHLTVLGSGRAWVDQQWLAQWLFFRVWEVGGNAGAAALAGALTAVGFALLAALLLERGSAPRRALKWTLLAFAVALPDTAVRSQAFAYPLFVAVLWLLSRDLDRERPTRGLVVVIGLLVVWANLHGSVLLGAAMVAAFCVRRAAASLGRDGRSSRIYGLAALLSLVSPLATPYGFRIVPYYRSTLGNGAIHGFASEWQSAFAVPAAAIAFFALVGVTAVVIRQGLRRGVRVDPIMLFGTGVLVAAGFSALRWEAWAAFPAVLLATNVLNRADPSENDPPPGLRRMALAAGGVLLVTGTVAVAAEAPQRYAAQTPQGAMSVVARYAAAHPAAKILADDTASSALLWMHPTLAGRLALDDRLEIFPTPAVWLWRDYTVGRLPPARSLVDGYDILLASSANRRLARELVRLPGRRILYRGRDGVAVVKSARGR